VLLLPRGAACDRSRLRGSPKRKTTEPPSVTGACRQRDHGRWQMRPTGTGSPTARTRRTGLSKPGRSNLVRLLPECPRFTAWITWGPYTGHGRSSSVAGRALDWASGTADTMFGVNRATTADTRHRRRLCRPPSPTPSVARWSSDLAARMSAVCRAAGSSPRGPSACGSIAARALVPAAMFAVIDRISYHSQLGHKLGLIEVETEAGEFAASHLCCHDERDCDGLAGGRDRTGGRI
jgi:hypothetical protein